ncbi:MAG: hypothetical protein P4L40_12700, partial [Terracidiphilus sp.]|nr:hypothetical protein [Terracidiphilus sp.]
MKRLPGVIVAAIVLILGSLFQLLLAVCMAFAGAVEHSSPDAAPATSIPTWMPVFMYGLCAFFVALAAWGILTSIGLLRLRQWARYSTLVIGGCLAVIGLISMLMTLVLLVVPLPMPPSTDPSHAPATQAMVKIIFGVIALVYGLISAIGVWWLIYFNRKKVRETFTGAPGHMVESRRPFLISVIAVFSMIGAVSCTLMAILPMPGAFFGWILHGWQKAAFYLVYATLLAAAGIGLWRLEESGRRLALAMQAFGLLHYIALLAYPSMKVRYSEELNRAWNLPQPQPSPLFSQNAFY